MPVAKHGNRALSSKSGAADVLGALGVKIELRPDEITRCIHEAGIGFMFAPAHHPATKNVAPTRVELGTRTIFNLLGPLSNPASVKRQMIGVFSRQWIEPMAQVLEAARFRMRLGGAWLRRARRDHHVRPDPHRGAGERRGPHLRYQSGGHRPRRGRSRTRSKAATPQATPRRCMAVLKGSKGPYRDIAIFNAAASLIVAGRAKDLKEGAAIATKSLDCGEAEGRLERLVKVSNADT